MNVKVNSQTYISETRAPRVQIVYDVDVSGEQKTIELPFVMGVMADLSGHDSQYLPEVADRRFVEIDANTLDHRLAEISPSLHLVAKNRLTDEGDISVDLQFRKMEDFRPDQFVRQIPSLAHLLEAREKLSALLAYMDGKAGAAELIKQIIQDPSLMKKLANTPGVAADKNAESE